VSLATSYKKHGLEYSGAMRVYTQYLNNKFMIPRLREQSGAYGANASFSRNGLFTMMTYRDPNLGQSYKIFDEALPFMKSEELNSEKLKPAILGALKPYYSDKSVLGKTSTMTSLYLTDQTWDDYMKIKKEILGTTVENLKTINAVLEKALPEANKAVAGNSQKLKAEAGFLKKVLPIK
jgi:Zn-dependent M16 (insulinase) family peptidase